MKYWIQSFLLGVPKVIVGFRSRDGILTRIEELDVASMPAMVAQRGRQWDGNVCINFAAEFLECENPFHPSPLSVCHVEIDLIDQKFVGLRSVIDDEGVWRIRRKAGDSRIEVFKTKETTGHGMLLPDDFINHRIKLSLPKADPIDEPEEEATAS